MTHTLASLTSEIEQLNMTGEAQTSIVQLSNDSRTCEPGTLFAAITGSQADGRNYIDQALELGASAILHDGTTNLSPDIPQLIHPDPRRILAYLASAFYGYPQKKLKAIAITGTNGKSTVAAMCTTILRHSGAKVGLVNTIGIDINGQMQPTTHTTPDAITLYSLLAEMVSQGCEWLVMEASSHALDQHRLAGIEPEVALFTNLSRDHLDYHGDMGAYFQAKAKLFREHHPKLALLPASDAHAQALNAICREQGVAVQNYGRVARQGVYAKQIQAAINGTKFIIQQKNNAAPVDLKIPGRFNLDNALAAAAACLGIGLNLETVAEGLNRFQSVTGRVEHIQEGQAFSVLVDFAHTPDALDRLLSSLRPLTRGKLWVVFGCGGDKDQGKRPHMGECAGRLSHFPIVTDDNPRSEDPAEIRRQIMRGCRNRNVQEMEDRGDAITYAIVNAQDGDTVVIAGKGHEQTQVGPNGASPFNDSQMARQALKGRAAMRQEHSH
ncbi:UDP-N-acetylmuramoyl-L-alanyl-D-glutamate--2,6-diaminopimelate ligase [Magnetococcus sp. PR-3]|uniref:UDP-N-acetylmuramoyl-L-alanyl-D-glutamate--2, 6-diaminopimelate ligase n=1 Tax=Magnetococcus sp. PR-3 TaxID=3120355 RepID=UPI002FCE056E